MTIHRKLRKYLKHRSFKIGVLFDSVTQSVAFIKNTSTNNSLSFIAAVFFCVYISHLNWVALTRDILNELRNIFLHQIFMRSHKWWCRQKRKMITNKYACARWFRIFFLLFIIFIFFGDKLCFSFLSYEFIYLHIIKSQNISILLLKEKIQSIKLSIFLIFAKTFIFSTNVAQVTVEAFFCAFCWLLKSQSGIVMKFADTLWA